MPAVAVAPNTPAHCTRSHTMLLLLLLLTLLLMWTYIKQE